MPDPMEGEQTWPTDEELKGEDKPVFCELWPKFVNAIHFQSSIIQLETRVQIFSQIIILLLCTCCYVYPMYLGIP